MEFVNPSSYNRHLLKRLIAGQPSQRNDTPTRVVDHLQGKRIEPGRIYYSEAVEIFLAWCRHQALRPDWVIIHDIQRFRDWLELRGFSEQDIDQWVDHIIRYL